MYGKCCVIHLCIYHVFLLYIVSVMIYNSMVKSETWSLYEDDRMRTNTTEMDALRRSARISKLDRKMNEYIREKMDVQDIVIPK